MWRKTLIAIAAAMAMCIASSAAYAYVGDWAYDDTPGGWEILNLGNNTNGAVRILRGTKRYCGRPGAAYATMRRVLLRNGTEGEQINWWVDATCRDGYVRVCVRNWRGESACSTYWDGGWD